MCDCCVTHGYRCKMLRASNAWLVSHYGTVNNNGVSDANGVRPVIMISPDVQILDGNGSYDNPYEI